MGFPRPSRRSSPGNRRSSARSTCRIVYITSNSNHMSGAFSPRMATDTEGARGVAAVEQARLGLLLQHGRVELCVVGLACACRAARWVSRRRKGMRVVRS